VRDPLSPKVEALRRAYPAAQVAAILDALEASRVLLVSTPHGAVADLVQMYCPAIDGKLVIDASNDFGAAVANNIQTILQAAPQAKVYRAFNALGWEIFADPHFEAASADLFYCGADNEHRPQVESLIAAAGLRPVWVGGLESAPVVDALGMLWVTLAFRRGRGRAIALKLLER
jgi:predicted dinucleotide-binding enzyme